MFARILVLAAAFGCSLPAQFASLATTGDGSSLYFTSTLRLKGAAEPRNDKIFVVSGDLLGDKVELFRAHDRVDVPAGSPPCTVAGFADYVGAETSAAGATAAWYRANAQGGCSYPPNPFSTEILTRATSTTLRGIARLSAGGNYAIVFNAATGRPWNGANVSFMDLRTGAEIPIAIPDPPAPQFVLVPERRGRVIADDGTAIIAVTDMGLNPHGGYVVRPGGDPKPFPLENALPLLIDSNATKVVYQAQDRSLHLLDLITLQSTELIAGDQPADAVQMSDDARRVLFLRGGQVHLLDTTTLNDTTLTDGPAKITDATISGDGEIVYAGTGGARLLRIDADSGSQTEIIGRTPYLQPYPGGVTPGLAITLNGAGLSKRVIEGTPPFYPFLDHVTMWIGERKVPLLRVAPDRITFLVPWDIQPHGGSIRILAEAYGEDTPFDFPEVEVFAPDKSMPVAGAIARQDWTQTYSGPVNTGEIIHVYAVGLGPVSPEVPDGVAAPSAEPLARITRPFTCSNAEILFAGLAPGTIERIYQVDMRIGPASGYQQFTCTLGGSDPFIFLSLNVIQ